MEGGREGKGEKRQIQEILSTSVIDLQEILKCNFHYLQHISYEGHEISGRLYIFQYLDHFTTNFPVFSG